MKRTTRTSSGRFLRRRVRSLEEGGKRVERNAKMRGLGGEEREEDRR